MSIVEVVKKDKITLSREEALVALIGLERYKKANYWQTKAIKTIVRQMGLSPSPLLAERIAEEVGK